MADPRFFDRKGPFTLAQLAEASGAEIADGADPNRLFHDVAPLDAAGPGEVAFLDNRKYTDAFARSAAGAAFVDRSHAAKAPAGMALLLTPEPYKAYARAAWKFYPPQSPPTGIATTAAVDPSVRLGADCWVGDYAVIEAGVEIGARCRIGHHAVIGRSVVLGDDVTVGSHASLGYCLIGSRVTLYPGVRIGQDGFGFAPDPSGHLKVPQLGRVIIEDDVEIGANTTVDRGAGPDTIVRRGTMIDNLVQLGHNVVVGRGCVLVAQVGISGSTKLGDFVMVGGQAGLAGHLTIGSGAKIAAMSGVMRDVPAGETVCGQPAVPIKEFFRQVAVVQRLAKKGGT